MKMIEVTDSPVTITSNSNIIKELAEDIADKTPSFIVTSVFELKVDTLLEAIEGEFKNIQATVEPFNLRIFYKKASRDIHLEKTTIGKEKPRPTEHFSKIGFKLRGEKTLG